MNRLFLALGAVSGFVGVVAGAFAAHALTKRLDPQWVDAFKTGAQYEMIHALALLAVAWAVQATPSRMARAAGWFFVAGTVLFSGSLYVLALTQTSWIGAITPFGGVCFLTGWALLAAAALSKRPGEKPKNNKSC